MTVKVHFLSQPISTHTFWVSPSLRTPQPVEKSQECLNSLSTGSQKLDSEMYKKVSLFQGGHLSSIQDVLLPLMFSD